MRGIALAAALAVALAVPVVPALQTVVGSEGWARAAEAFLLVFFFRVALLLFAVHEGTFGFLGISLATHEASARAVEDRLLVRIGRISARPMPPPTESDVSRRGSTSLKKPCSEVVRLWPW
jgi:hypothetical protein